MLRRLASVLVGDDRFELRHRLFHWILLFAVTFCVIGSVVNLGLGLPLFAIVFPVAYGVVLVGLYLTSRIGRFYAVPAIVTMLSLIFIANPLFWFLNAGSEGGAQYYSLSYTVPITILFRDWRRYLFLVLHIGVLISLVLLELRYPELVVPYPDAGGRAFDVALSISIVVFGIFAFFDVYASRYEENTAALESLARTDGLTGLLNHRASLDRLAAEHERALRYSRDFSIVMFDVDHFKRLNDEQGHQRGDVVLAGIGAILLQQLRRSDIAGRYGGEEFIVILPETATEQAQLTAKKICAVVREKLGVTLSGGVCQWDKTETPDAIVGRADALLYSAKNAGRDRVLS